MDLEFDGEVIHWRGPPPYHFVTIPVPESAALRDASSLVSYGWGVIPVTARVGRTEWTTSLFPKDGGYLLPVKDAVRTRLAVDVGDTVTVRLHLDV